MPQSMLAFLALSMAAFFAMNQQRAEIGSYESMIENEYEIMANAVAIEQLEIIAASTAWDDLETWDNMELARVFGLKAFQESFDLTIGVQYVDASGNPSITPTTTKEVSVLARNDRFVLPLVAHARLINE